MKLVLQHSHRPDEISGVLTSLNELLPALVSRPGFEVRLVSTKGASWRDQVAAVFWADAVMLNSNCLPMALVGRLLARTTLLKLHYPQYHTVHWDFEPMSFSRRMRTELSYFLRMQSSVGYKAASVLRLLARTTVAFVVHRVCACSVFCAAQASLPRRVHLLRNPIHVSPGLPRRTLAELDRPYRFVFVGRIMRDKGWDTVVAAAALLANRGRDFRVDVIGDGPDFAVMREAASAAGQGERFRFHGRLDAVATKQAMRGALCALMPSRVQETAGYVPLEAAALRVPSIVAKVGGLPETAGPDCLRFSAGCADELAERMSEFLDDPERSLSAGFAAYRHTLELFDPRRVADELLDLLGNGASSRRMSAAANGNGSD